MKCYFALISILAMPTMAVATADPQAFHQAVYALHEKQLSQFKIKTEQEEGKYGGAAAARYRYLDTRHYDATSGQLLSHVRRDAAMPEFVHTVEVNIYENGRVVRDFGSLSMPWAPAHPVRTFINLHHYIGQLHSFRQYNFYGDVGYEFCEGTLGGKRVNISLDGSDINAISTATPAYQACFAGMRSDWERYKTPH